MEYTHEELMQALRNANAAGDADAVKYISETMRAQLKTQSPVHRGQIDTSDSPFIDISKEENARQDYIVGNANKFDRFMFGVLSGLMDVGKGIGLFKDMTPDEQAALASLNKKFSEKKSFFQDAGQFVGQTAPFLGGAGIISQLPKGAARLAAAAGYGAGEGAIIANGTEGNIPTGAAIGAVAAPIAELAGPAIGKVMGKASEMLKRGNKQIVPQTNEQIVEASKSSSGRKMLEKALSEVHPDVYSAAEVTGIGIEKLTPGQRSGNPGLQDVEGVLSSVAGTVKDAQSRGFDTIKDSMQKDLKSLGAEAGTSSEKTSLIRERVVDSLNNLRKIENDAWDKLRNISNPMAKEKAANLNAHLNAENLLSNIDNSVLSSVYKNIKKPLTFEQMKEYRGRIYDALETAIRGGQSNAARKLIEAKNALTEDMSSMANKYGFINEWEKANNLSRQYNSMKDSAKIAFGESLDNDQFIKKLNSAFSRSSEYGTAPIHKMISALPENERGIMIASALSRAVEKGSHGGTSAGLGIKHFSEIMTPQNLSVIRKYLPQQADLLSSYAIISRFASASLKNIEHTGRSMPSLKRLENGVNGIVGKLLNAFTNRSLDVHLGVLLGANMGTEGLAISGVKYATEKFIERAVQKRSVKFIMEKAIKEGTNAARAGGSDAAIEAAEKRLLLNPNIIKIIRQEFTKEEASALLRTGIVATSLGLHNNGDQ